MDKYKQIVEYYNETLIFKFSSIGYALKCDLIFTDRLILLPLDKSFELLKYLKDGNKIFINIGSLLFMENLHKIINNIKSLNIKVIFYLQFEPIIPPEIIELLLPISYSIYNQNNHYSHQNVHCMPIGIRDCGITIKPGHENFYHTYLFNQGLKNVIKKHLCLISGFANTHPDRLISYNCLKDKSFIYDISNFKYSFNMTSTWGKIPSYKFYNFIHQSFYVIAPSGLGVDTHRFFEAIYLKTIPIVKKTNSVFDKIYEIFPCLVINEWSDITKELLDSNLDNLTIKMNEFHEKYKNCYTDISLLDELLLQT